MRAVKITESLKKIHQRYVSIRDELSDQGSSNNFRSIMNNLLSPIMALETNDRIDSNPSVWSNLRPEYKRNLRLVKEYLSLIKEFPKFRESELRETALEERLLDPKTKLNPEEFVIFSYQALRRTNYYP